MTEKINDLLEVLEGMAFFRMPVSQMRRLVSVYAEANNIENLVLYTSQEYSCDEDGFGLEVIYISHDSFMSPYRLGYEEYKVSWLGEERVICSCTWPTDDIAELWRERGLDSLNSLLENLSF